MQPIQPTTKDIFLRWLSVPVYASSDNFLCYFLKNYVCSYPAWTLSSMEQEMWTFFSLGALVQGAAPKNPEDIQPVLVECVNKAAGSHFMRIPKLNKKDGVGNN